MKFICEKSSLVEGISIAQKAVTGKSTMPILGGILINAKNNTLVITGSDIDLSIETKVKAAVLEEGSIVVDARLFGDIIRKLPNADVEVASISENSIEIKCEKSKFNLIHMDAEDYPSLPSVEGNKQLNIAQKCLKNMIKGTIFAVAQDETRPILTGVLMESKDKTLNLVSLDGYRLALKKESIEFDEEVNAVIPGKTLNEVVKILGEDDDVTLTFNENHVLFTINETRIISRLLEGEFIKYNSIIPEEHKSTVIVDKNILLNSIERASLVGKEGNTNLVKFDIEDDTIVITSNSQLGNVREEVNINLQGDGIQIAFNSKYLIDILKIMDEEKIYMEFTSAVSPCVIKNIEKDNCTYLVLPVRVSTR